MRKIPLCLSCQVDEVMQEKLLNIKKALDGETGPQGKAKKGEKVRAARWENSIPCPGTVVVSANLGYKYQNVHPEPSLNLRSGTSENLFTCGCLAVSSCSFTCINIA